MLCTGMVQRSSRAHKKRVFFWLYLRDALIVLAPTPFSTLTKPPATMEHYKLYQSQERKKNQPLRAQKKKKETTPHYFCVAEDCMLLKGVFCMVLRALTIPVKCRKLFNSDPGGILWRILWSMDSSCSALSSGKSYIYSLRWKTFKRDSRYYHI